MKKSKNVPPMGGAGNPYVLAEHKLGKKIDWDHHSPHEIKLVLENAFGMPYAKMFSPKHKSPVHTAIIKKTRGTTHD